ncbi:MAG: hypothetical protein AAF957_02260 [Planctomycetota bacterium]
MHETPIRTSLGLLALTAFLSVATACSSTKGSASSNAEYGVWTEPTADLARQIEQRAMRVSVIASPSEFVELSDWFQTIGEPAYPRLLEMVEIGDMRQRSFALSVISALRDRRLVAPLKAVMPEKALEIQTHRYEYARALATMGDYEMLPALIDGLQDDDHFLRALANQTLREVTNNDVPYEATAPREERQIAVEAWKSWYQTQQEDALLQRD